MKPLSNRQVVLSGIILGAVYGLFVRYMFGLEPSMNFRVNDSKAHLEHLLGVMTVIFIFGAPLALGFITVWFGERRERFSWWERIVMPWISVLACLFGCLLFAWEGVICIVLWLPVALVLSSAGGIVAWLAGLVLPAERSRLRCVAAVALLPFATAPIEAFVETESEIKTVETHIEINAAPEVVWEQIKSVPRIAESEHAFSLVHLMGFPRPTEAVIEGEGVGAVRYARFEGNVLFLETITDWKPCEELAFSIRADTENIPPTTFDEHVTIGGPYFDVLNGVYRIERLGKDRVMLHLSSDQRLSTKFNAYSHLWTEWLMADLQNYILRIIRRRCEQGAPTPSALKANS